MQCHTTIKRKGNLAPLKNKEELLFGRESLRSYGLTQRLVVEKSWERRDNIGPPNGRLAMDLMKELPRYNRSMIALPICISPYTKISSFDGNTQAIHSVSGKRDRNQGMACVCGDWKGNETRNYMEALNIHPGSKSWNEGELDEQMGIICPHVSQLCVLLTSTFGHCFVRLTTTFTNNPSKESTKAATGQQIPCVLRARHPTSYQERE